MFNKQNYLSAMKRMLTVFLFIVLITAVCPDAAAQCAMCTATVESAQGAGSSVADGINKGVMYLFFTPYLIIGTIGYFWWRARKKAQQ